MTKNYKMVYLTSSVDTIDCAKKMYSQYNLIHTQLKQPQITKRWL